MGQTLDFDCWFSVLKHLSGDFRTMSRLLCTSKDMFALTAPVMYGQLFDSDQIPTFDEWPLIKKRQLAYLLLQSSGFLHQLATNLGQEEPLMETGIHIDDPQFTIQHFSSWRPVYAQQLYIGYHQYLKRLPVSVHHQILPMGGVDTHRLPSAALNFFMHHCSVVEAVRFTSLQDIDDCLPLVERFTRLKRIFLAEGEWFKETQNFEKAMDKAKSFLVAHGKHYPGQLEEVTRQNHGVRPFCQFITIRVLKISSKELGLMPKSVFGNLKELTVNVGVNAQTVPQLEWCPRLEMLKLIHVPSFDITKDSLIFEWALKSRELKKRQWQQQQQQEQQLSYQRYADHGNESLDTVPPIKTLVLLHIPIHALLSAMNAFQDSLESLTSGWVSRVQLTWNWTLTRLTSLRLTGCKFDFGCLTLCPLLESLRLSNVSCFVPTPRENVFSNEQQVLWLPPVKLKFFQISYSERAKDFDPSGFEHLNELQELVMEALSETDVTIPLSKRIEESDTSLWRLEKLQIIHMNHGSIEQWKAWRILAMAPKLKMLRLGSYLEPPTTILTDNLSKPMGFGEMMTIAAAHLTFLNFQVLLGQSLFVWKLLESLVKFPDQVFPSLRVLFVSGSDSQDDSFGSTAVEIMKREAMRHLCVHQQGNRDDFWMKWLEKVEFFRVGKWNLTFEQKFMRETIRRQSKGEGPLSIGPPYCILSTHPIDPLSFFRRKDLALTT